MWGSAVVVPFLLGVQNEEINGEEIYRIEFENELPQYIVNRLGCERYAKVQNCRRAIQSTESGHRGAFTFDICSAKFEYTGCKRRSYQKP